MTKQKRNLFEFDLILFFSTLALMIIGILFIYSSGVNAEGVVFSNEYVKQIIWVCLGLVLLFMVTFFDYFKLKDFSFYIYIGFSLLLIYTRFFGKVVKGARSWLDIIAGMGIQPSEFMKIATILFLAKFLNDTKDARDPLKRFLTSVGIILFPVLLILSQPDFGTALVYLPIFIVMMYVGGIELRYVLFTLITALTTMFFTVLPLWEKFILKSTNSFLIVFHASPYNYILLGVLFLAFVLAVVGLITFKKTYYYWIAFVTFILFISIGASLAASKILKEYQIMRLIVFLDPSIDPKGSGWNIIQSITAIGSGGLFGKGFLQGTQSHYRFLPEQSTDFIFSIISEETGFVGSLIVFTLFFIILYRGLSILKTTRDNFGRLICSGIIAMISFHFMINIGMSMGVMPITGIPLFFLSYGGSSLWVALLGVGLMLSIHQKRYR